MTTYKARKTMAKADLPPKIPKKRGRKRLPRNNVDTLYTDTLQQENDPDTDNDDDDYRPDNYN